MTSVLVIEDEPLIALSVKNILEKKGFFVVGCAANLEEAYGLFVEYLPDIVISDIKLENGESGIEVVKKLQAIESFVACYITSYSDEHMMEKALETNPISYLTKPFKESDLCALLKIAALKIEEKNKASICDLIYNKATKALFYKGVQVVLSKQESDLFHICYLNKGAFVSMSAIEELIWNCESVSSSTKRGLFHRLKKKLSGDVFEYSHGIGCRLKCVL